MVTIILDEEAIFKVACRIAVDDDELQRFRSEADELLESLDMLPPPSVEHQMGQPGEEETRADEPQTQPERSSEPVLETAGADPS